MKLSSLRNKKKKKEIEEIGAEPKGPRTPLRGPIQIS